MATYEVTGPDGARYEITAPDNMAQADVLSRFRREVAGGQTNAPSPPSAPDASAPGIGESLLRGLGEGATLGFGDEAGLLSRERQEASRRANPWSHFIGEMLGTVAPALVAAPVAAGRLGASALARGAQALARPFAPTPGPLTLGRSLGEGARLGAVYGGISGVGHADPGPNESFGNALMRRIGGGLTGGLVGGALGAPLGAATYPISRALQGIGGARAAAGAETENAGAGALTAFSRALERDRITPDDLIRQITDDLPVSRSPRLATPDQIERLVARVNEGATQADLIREFGIAASTARRLHAVVTERFATPLNLVDRTKLVRPGAGENTGYTLRAASATPGEARATAREALTERQLGQGQRISDEITRRIGTPDYEGTVARLTRESDNLNRTLYDAAHRADEAALAAGRSIGDAIQPVLDANATRWAFQRGPVASAIGRAIEAFRPRAGRVDRPLTSLQEFMQAKQNLQALFDESVNNRTVMRELTRFRNELYDAVSAHNPVWRVANDAAADGFSAQRALNLGMEYAGRLGQQTRDQLARFRAMPDPEKELYRVGVAQRIHERIMNRAETHDLTSELRLPGVRQTLRVILGDRQANALFARIDREFATTRTYREQFGSQTTPLREAIDDLSWAPRMESVTQLLNPREVVRMSAEWLARGMNERRNQQLMGMLTNMNPIEQLALLRQMGPLHQARTNWGLGATYGGQGALNQAFPNALLGAVADFGRQNERALRR